MRSEQNDILIREGTKNDHDVIRQISHKSIEQNYQSFLSKEKFLKRLEQTKSWNIQSYLNCTDNFLLVATNSSNVILGFLIGCHHHSEQSTYIDDIRIDTDYQHQGIGTLLMNYLDSSYSKYKCLLLDVNKDNVNAVKFYEKLNYVPLNFYKNRIRMHKNVHCQKTHSVEEFNLC